MDSRIFEPFVDGVRTMLDTMFGISCDFVDDGTLDDPYVTGVISLSGATSGQAALTFSRASALKTVGELLMMEPDELDDDLLEDGIGEMVNIVAGQAKSGLEGSSYTFEIGIPVVSMVDDEAEAIMSDPQTKCCRVESSLGVMALTVWIL